MARNGVWVAALCAAAGLGISGGAAHAHVGDGERGHWLLDDVGGTTALDSSGHDNHGAVQDAVGDGQGFYFNGTSARVVVPDHDSLDPGAADFSFGATFVVASPPALKETYDVLRKGLASTPGGDYKLELKQTKGVTVARCLVKDSSKVVAAVTTSANAAYDLADGEVHTVTCTKTSTGVSVALDGLTPRKKTVAALGGVSNASDVGIGAKAEATAKTGFDWFHGTLFDAWVAVGG